MSVVETLGRRGKEGQGSERSRRYQVLAANEDAAIGATVNKVAADLGGLTLAGYPLLTIEVTEAKVAGVWDATATFGIARGIEQQSENETRTGFEFSQDNIRIRHAIQTARYGIRPPNHHGAINVVKDAHGVSVEGIDVPASSFTFSKTRIFPLALIHSGFLADIGAIDKHWNLFPFAGFPAGEVLFVGLVGQQRSDVDYECTFRFARRPNESGLVIGGVAVPFKRGWDYVEVLWFEEHDEANAALVPRARAVYVHQVFHGANFNFLGLQ